MRQCGSITVALTEERKEEIFRQASLARAFNVDVREISPAEVKALYPHLNTSDVVAGVHLPLDGQCDPANIAMALAKGARMRGAKIFEHTKVTAVHKANGRVTGVSWKTDTEEGRIDADVVVNCAGMWARDLGAMSGVSVPLHACEHFYLITEPVAGIDLNLPVLRVPDECAYYKQDAGKMMLGAFETKAKPWGIQVAGNFRRSAAVNQFERVRRQFANVLANHKPVVSRVRTPMGRRAIYAVRIGADSRGEADRICSALRSSGGACIVMKNR